MNQDLVSTNKVGESITLDLITQQFVAELKAKRGPHLWETSIEESESKSCQNAGGSSPFDTS